MMLSTITTPMLIEKDYLASDPEDDSYTGRTIHLPCEEVVPDNTRRFNVYDDDDELYYRITIENCDDMAVEAAYMFFARDSGATYLKDITGDGTDMSVG